MVRPRPFGPRCPISTRWVPLARRLLESDDDGLRLVATDGRRLVLPAFGAYTGGLNVLDPTVAALFRPDFRVHLLHGERVYSFPRGSLVA